MWIAVSTLLSLTFYSQIVSYVKDKEIMGNGIIVKGKILDVSFSRGYNIEFEYKIHNNKYKNSGNITSFSVEKGDSIVFKVLPTEPEGQFHVLRIANQPPSSKNQ